MIARVLRIGGVSVLSLGVAAATLLLGGQPPAAPQTRTPMVEDWTSRHMVFSAPHSLIQNLQLERDPRYFQQYVRRNVAPYRSVAASAPGPTGFSERFGGPSFHGSFGPPSRDPVSILRRGTNDLYRDWAEPIVANATMGDGQFPAKYSFNAAETVNSASCTSDYVVYMTKITGVGATTLDIYALDNLYSGTCTNGPVPNVMWAYKDNVETGSGPIGSPVLSLDGTQVAWIEGGAGGGSATTNAVLHILRFGTVTGGAGGCGTTTAVNQGTIATPCNIPGLGATQYTTSGATYKTCKTTAGQACEIHLGFNNDDDDTTSSPYYDYASDTIYVGDADGDMHQFTGVFGTLGGSPAENLTDWPILVNGATSPLGSPVMDETSQNVFVGSANGNLRAVLLTGSTTGSTCNGGGMAYPCRAANEFSVGSAVSNDGPIVDSTTQRVFVFANDTGTGAVVGEDDTGLTAGNQKSVTVGASTTSTFHDGTFDNGYYTSDTSLLAATGNLYVCGNSGTAAPANRPTLFQIGVSAGVIGTATNEYTAATASTECSPVTEFYNPNANLGVGQDNLYFSVQADAPTTTDCSGDGCVFAATLSGTGTGQTVVISGALTSSGGSSGIDVDNESTASGAANVYYSYLGNSSATYACTGVTGVGCSIQVSQGGLGSKGYVVQSFAGDNASSTSQTTRLNSPATNGDLILLVAHWNNQAANATVSDGTNTYTALGPALNIGTTDRLQAWYASNVTGNPQNFTVNFSAQTTSLSLLDVIEYAGLNTADTATYATNTATIAGATMTTGASGTTTATNETIIGMFAPITAGGLYPYSAGPGFTMEIEDTSAAIEDMGVATENSYTALATANNSGFTYGAIIVGFKNSIQ